MKIQVGFATDRRAGTNGNREGSTQRELAKVCGAMQKGGAVSRNFLQDSADTLAIMSSEGRHYREFFHEGREHTCDPVF